MISKGSNFNINSIGYSLNLKKNERPKNKNILYFLEIFVLKDVVLKTPFPGSFPAPKAPEKIRGFLRFRGGIVGEEVTTEPPKAAEEKKQCFGGTSF